MATIKEIAQRAGVSVSTVSRTLNNYPDVNPQTKEKILQIAKELNYFPNAVARSLVQKKTYTIGVFFGNKMNSGFDHPFFLDVISAVREVAGNAGYDLLVFTNKNKERATYTTLCRERSVDGVVLLLTGEGKRRTEPLVELQNSGIPCIAIDIPLIGEKTAYVESDNYAGAKLAVQHLIDLGHRRIAFIGGDEISKTSYDRLRGYQDTLMENRIGFDPTLIRLGYFSKEKAALGTRELMANKPDITAFFAASDEMAFSVIKTLRDLGKRVPDDISVVGFDDIKEAEFFEPRLTTVRQDKYQLGSEAARMLLNIIENPDYQPTPVTLPSQLIIRQSTAVLQKRFRQEGEDS
ncbi:LacI family DNA-binding transcriptional regulator [Lihuaxuella thermophila]|uniref:LacI family transcriptional regulator n=1 Tax=Lihuaxuella thermophila TaxID=1173111 RepID=A0A1H8AKM4_9BACL|nr:LacI family DNA-binding transcriptional regulator [Lihuaxuella thermophila]SEM70329.1 LacI family transcriptional regulator [Lihuaxuella thermophila]